MSRRVNFHANVFGVRLLSCSYSVRRRRIASKVAKIVRARKSIIVTHWLYCAWWYSSTRTSLVTLIDLRALRRQHLAMDDRKVKLDPPDWARLFALFALGGTTTRLRAHGLGVPLRRPSERFSYLRAYGFKTDYNCRHIGLNGKLSELNAALGWLSLDLLGEAVTRRQAQVQQYRQALESCVGLVWQKAEQGASRTSSNEVQSHVPLYFSGKITNWPRLPCYSLYFPRFFERPPAFFPENRSDNISLRLAGIIGICP